MRTRTTLSLLLCVLLVVVTVTACQAQIPGDAPSADQDVAGLAAMSATNVSLEFKQTPLADALDTLLKGTGVSYIIDPSVNDLKVSAVLKNVSVETALKEITKAAGVVYRIDGNVVNILRKKEPFRASPAAPSAGPGNEAVVIPVRHLNAGDIARVLPNFGASVMVISGDKLVLSGSAEAIDKTMNVIRALDVPPPAVRPVGITVDVELHLPGNKPAAIKLSTQSVGAEGRPMPLNISSNKVETYETEMTSVSKTGKPIDYKLRNSIKKTFRLDMTLTPTPTLSDDLAERISLTGSGHITVDVPSSVKYETHTIDKLFQVAASVEDGKQNFIAAGSVDLGSGTARFIVTVCAAVQEGTVMNLPPPCVEPTAPALPGSPPPGRGGSFGGGSLGGG